MLMCNTQGRKEELLATLRSILASGSLDRGELAKVRGRLQFASGQLFGRLARQAVHAFSSRGRLGNGLDQRLVWALEYLCKLLSEGRPREISRGLGDSRLIFVDASFEPGGYCGLGGLVFDGSGTLLKWFGLQAPRALVTVLQTCFGEHRETVIYELEALAVALAIDLFKQELQGRNVMVFTDNSGVHGSFVKCWSDNPVGNALAYFTAWMEYELHAFVYYDRVPSPSNPADDPSRQGQRSGQETTRTLDGWRRSVGRQELQMLKTLVLRHEHSLSQLVLFFNTSDMGTLTLLKEITNNWQKAYQEKKTTTTLRAALLTSLWLELETRLAKLESDQAATKLYVDSGHLHLNPTRWSYTAWDQEKQQSLPTEEPPLANQEIVAALKILKAAALTDGVIHRFSPLHKLTDSPQSKVVVFQLVLTTRPTAEKVHAEMSKLTNLAVTSLVGMRIRPERLQISPLAKQMMHASTGGGLRAPHPRQDPEQEPGRLVGHRVARGSRSPHPRLGGYERNGQVQPKGDSDTLPPGQPSKGNASTLKRGRPGNCQGLTASVASQSKQAASAKNDTFSRSPKRLMQTSLSSWQVPGGADDLEAPCYLFLTELTTAI